MALGDGIRRNLATVSKEERDLFIDAILKLNTDYIYPGARTDFPAGHVSYWFKQDEIHQSTHVHHCPQFLPWHREMCNRFEALLRTVHPELSLHYWDWNLDPSNMPDGDGGFINLFDASFMGNADGTVDPQVDEFNNPIGGAVGEPFRSAGFYLPNPPDQNYRDTSSPVVLNRPDPNNTSTWSYPAHANPADPPKFLTRDRRPGTPPIGKSIKNPFGGDWTVVPDGTAGSVYWPRDDEFVNAPSWEAFNDVVQGLELGTSNNGPHALVHTFIGGNGTLTDPHTSFRDPFVFLFHSNIDRLWAMWQRKDPAVRLDPAQLYHTDSNSKGSGDVEIGDPNWGILSPMEPWAGNAAQTAATGIIGDVWPIRPWFAPENEQNLPGNDKDAKDPSIVIPPSYDTALHSSYIVTERDTFSSFELETTLSYPQAFQVIYDGFTPDEIGLPAAAPAISFLDAPNGSVIASINVALPPAVDAENPAAHDSPQRITFTFDINFTGNAAFPVLPVETRDIYVRATLGAQVDIAPIRLTSQPNPYMIDIQGGNPAWLSTDVRVFQLKPNEKVNPASNITIGDIGVDANAPYQYIQALLTELRGFANAPALPFENITRDEQGSQLELSRTVLVGTNHIPVCNFAVAKVRYRASTAPATDVRVFFRTFNTMVSALDYHTDTNYRRRADGIIPLPGLIGSEVASIPYFAEARVGSAVQGDDNNKQTIQASGGEWLMYFGCWLDFNQPSAQVDTPGGPASIMQLVRGIHQCMVAEIRFQPGATDPIITGATPASSDHLAQRNLAIIESDNPGIASTHVVQHTILVKPSAVFKAVAGVNAKALANAGHSYDELVIRWNNLPRNTVATLFFPEWDADELLFLAASLRQTSKLLKKVDANTIECTVTDISYIPVPGNNIKPFAGLITLQLPQGVKDGQLFTVDIQQHSGQVTDLVVKGRGNDKDKKNGETVYHVSKRKVLGAIRLTIPVKMGTGLLKREIKNLAVLRYIAQAIPVGDRWYPVFTRYIAQVAEKVRGLGVDPGLIKASPDDPGIPGTHGSTPTDLHCLTGKVCEVIFDCFGDFEGFVLDTCSGAHHIPCREKAIAEIVLRACKDRLLVAVCVDDKKPAKIHKVLIKC